MKVLIAMSLAVVCLALLSQPVTADAVRRFEAHLSAAQEVVLEGEVLVPADINSDASGRMIINFRHDYSEMFLVLRVRNLVGNFSAAHLHCAAPGANGPVAFGLVSPGPLTFDGMDVAGSLTNADFAGGDCEAAIGRPVNNLAALAFAMRDGLIYINVHTSEFASGEIRGQIIPRGN